MAFKDFFKHYLIAALWSSMDEVLVCQECGIRYNRSYESRCCGEHNFEKMTVNLDLEYTVDSIDEDSLKKLREEAEKFYEENKHFFLYKEHSFSDGTYTDDMLAGHDFWLTRNGHGAGFWDRGIPFGDYLTEQSHKYCEINLYIGDDDKIHLD